MMPIISRKPLLWFALALSLLLNGCALVQTQPPVEADTSVDAAMLHDHHMVIIENIQQFSLKGRLGVMTNPKSFSGRVAWQHTPDGDDIDVFSPLGGKVAHILRTPEQVLLTDSKNKLISAPDAETLTEETLGFKLPLSGLSYWVLGRPSDTGLVNYVTWDNQGRINALQQNGWDIKYQGYNMHDGYALPRKVTLRTDTLVIKIIVEKWFDIQTR